MSRPVAIVTGGRRGIGRAIALSLAGRGFDLALTDLGPAGEGFADLEALGAKVAYFDSDLAGIEHHAATVEQILAAFGHIDLLVNNAGIASPIRGDFIELSPETFDAVIRVNLRGTVFFTQAVLRAMLAAESSAPRAVVTITSSSAEMVSPDRLDYCMSKAALAMLSQGLAVRLAEAGIASFEVRPGIIRSEMTAKVSEKYDRLIEDGIVPMRRWGDGEDIGRVVASLASGDFNFATGSVIDVGGGLSIQRL